MGDQGELLTVTDRFLLDRLGLVLTPDFPVPRGWHDRSETVTLVRPASESLECHASFFSLHLNIRDPRIPSSQRWRVVVTLPALKQEDVPVGTRVLCSRPLCELLSGEGSVHK